MSEANEAALTTAERELAENGAYLTTTIGHSMEPLFSHRRDAVVIARPDRELKKYDVVLYPGGEGRFVLHRIIGVGKEHFIIRGDNTHFKELVPKSDIIGVLVSFTRKGKKHEVTELGYRAYSRIRCASYPIRVLARRVRAMLSRIKRAILGKKK